MSDSSHTVISPDGRHRVAYEMASSMWWETHNRNPTVDDQDVFLKLVKACTQALVWRDS